MIFDSIKSKIKPGTIIPQPVSKGYKVKGYGRSRGEEALVYYLPNRNKPETPSGKRVPVSDWNNAYNHLKVTGIFNREQYKNLSCSKDGGCSFTVIGGTFCLLRIAEYDKDNKRYKLI